MEVDEIFAEIEPYFAKRWLKVQLSLDSPQQGRVNEMDRIFLVVARVKLRGNPTIAVQTK